MGKIAYLDNSATSKPTERVVRAVAEAMESAYFNPSALYKPALECEKQLREARSEILRALGVSSGQVIFTSGGTEANNLAILGSISAMRDKRHVITTAQEHPSVLAAFEALEALGHRVTILPVDREGQVDFKRFSDVLNAEEIPALVSIMQVNNETGAMPQLEALLGMLKRRAPDALVHVDGVQGFLRAKLDMKLIDLYTLSAHKIHGLKGTGALYIRPGVRVLPRQLGGGQEQDLRSGTENTPGILSLNEVIREFREMGDISALLHAKKLLLHRLILEKVPDAQVNGPAPECGAPHILNMSFPDVRAEVFLHALEERGVYVSTGAACSSRKRKASPVLLAMRVPPALAQSALRFSLSPFTSDDEIAYAAECVGELYQKLRLVIRR